MAVRRLLCSGLLGLAGCGPLAGGDYYGQPLFEIEGSVQADFELDYDGDVGVALLWSNDTELDTSAQAVLVETRFPARYRLKIFQPPARESTLQVVGDQVLEASVGQILLFEDRDGDGDWNPEAESLIGGAYNAAVLFVPDATLPYADAAGNSAAPPLEPGVDESPEEPRPIWTPTGGFHLVEVAPGPFCQFQWESWLQPTDEKRATLYVGYYRGLGADWDCDGAGDFYEEDLAPPPEGDPDWNFDDQCPPYEVMLEECDFVREQLDQFADDFQGAAPLDWAQGFLPFLDDCYLQVCPDVIERLAAAVVEP